MDVFGLICPDRSIENIQTPYTAAGLGFAPTTLWTNQVLSALIQNRLLATLMSNCTLEMSFKTTSIFAWSHRPPCYSTNYNNPSAELTPGRLASRKSKVFSFHAAACHVWSAAERQQLQLAQKTQHVGTFWIQRKRLLMQIWEDQKQELWGNNSCGLVSR